MDSRPFPDRRRCLLHSAFVDARSKQCRSVSPTLSLLKVRTFSNGVSFSLLLIWRWGRRAGAVFYGSLYKEGVVDLSGLVLLLVLLKVILVAWLVAIAMLADEYKKKCGPDEKTPVFTL